MNTHQALALTSALVIGGSRSDESTAASPDVIGTTEDSLGSDSEGDDDTEEVGSMAHQDRSDSARALVLKAVTILFADFDVAAAGALLTDDCIQHNPGVPTGA